MCVRVSVDVGDEGGGWCVCVCVCVSVSRRIELRPFYWTLSHAADWTEGRSTGGAHQVLPFKKDKLSCVYRCVDVKAQHVKRKTEHSKVLLYPIDTPSAYTFGFTLYTPFHPPYLHPGPFR
jgi:hypothetical protein